MAALSSVASVFPHMLRDPLASTATVWSPEAAAGAKKSEEPQDNDSGDSSNDSTSASGGIGGIGDASPTHFVDVSVAASLTSLPADSSSHQLQPPGDCVSGRVGRSQSLTDPTTPPMFASPTASTSPVLADSDRGDSSSNNSRSPAAVGRSQPPTSEPECIRATAPLTATTGAETAAATTSRAAAPLVSPQQLASDPRFARRNRRSMSAEFTLSMLQQELGYPKRKSSRRDSAERKSRRASSILEEEQHNSQSSSSDSSGDKSDDAPLRPRSSTAEPEPECRSARLSTESATQCRRSSVSGKPDANDDGDASDDEGDDEDDNFLATRVASVTGFSQDADGVVYYEIIVRSVAHGPLSAYKVRRRYSEFRALHRALAAIMPVARRAHVGALAHAQAPHAFNSASDDQQLIERSGASLGTAGSITSTSTATAAVIELPPLPDRGGLWAYFQFDTTPFLERRAQHFDALLVACQSHARARASRLLNDFLGPPPDSVARHTSVENSYVSLNRFAAPKLRLSVEAHERKQKARNISRRRSSVHRAFPLEPAS